MIERSTCFLRRRTFLSLATAASVTGLVPGALRMAGAQTIRKIGWLAGTAGPLPTPAYLEALQAGLREFGWREGQNLRIDQRWGDRTQAPKLAGELLQLQPDVLVAQGAMVLGLRELAPKVPIVFGFSGDPVEAQLVRSFSRPGGNATGIAMQSLSLVGKRIEILKELAPDIQAIGILANPAHPGEQLELKASSEAAGMLGLKVSYCPVYSSADFDPAFAKLLADKVGGVIAFPDALLLSRAVTLAEFQNTHRIPIVSGWSEFVDAGCLFSYGPNLRSTWRQAAKFVDRILRGQHPSNIPVEQPSRYEFVLHAGAAGRISLTIPATAAVRIDRMVR